MKRPWKDPYQHDNCRYSVGEKLKRLRQNAGVTQAAIGKFLHLTRQGYGAIERGQRSATFALLFILADYYGVSAYGLIDDRISPDRLLRYQASTQNRKTRHTQGETSHVADGGHSNEYGKNTTSEIQAMDERAQFAYLASLFHKLDQKGRNELFLIAESREMEL